MFFYITIVDWCCAKVIKYSWFDTGIFRTSFFKAWFEPFGGDREKRLIEIQMICKKKKSEMYVLTCTHLKLLAVFCRMEYKAAGQVCLTPCDYQSKLLCSLRVNPNVASVDLWTFLHAFKCYGHCSFSSTPALCVCAECRSVVFEGTTLCRTPPQAHLCSLCSCFFDWVWRSHEMTEVSQPFQIKSIFVFLFFIYRHLTFKENFHKLVFVH